MKYKEYRNEFSETSCLDAVDWLETQPDLAIAWDNCERGDWLWWALRKLNNYTIPKEISVRFARWCAGRANKHAAYTADAYAYAAAYTADAYAYAAAYAAAAERLEQAEWIREHVDNPWKAGE